MSPNIRIAVILTVDIAVALSGIGQQRDEFLGRHADLGKSGQGGHAEVAGIVAVLGAGLDVRLLHIDHGRLRRLGLVAQLSQGAEGCLTNSGIAVPLERVHEQGHQLLGIDAKCNHAFQDGLAKPTRIGTILRGRGRRGFLGGQDERDGFLGLLAAPAQSGNDRHDLGRVFVLLQGLDQERQVSLGFGLDHGKGTEQTAAQLRDLGLP